MPVLFEDASYFRLEKFHAKVQRRKEVPDLFAPFFSLRPLREMYLICNDQCSKFLNYRSQ